MDLKLDKNKHDMVFVNGDCPMTLGMADSTAQKLSIRLRAFQGEWFRDVTYGTPWFSRVFGKKVSKTMGMYNDHISKGRETWTYIYKGADLLPAAERLYQEYKAKEMEARIKHSDLMRDPSIPQNDRRLAELKNDIEHFGKMKEQCEVFKYEFSRCPEIEYKLGLGDVTLS